MKWWLVFFGGGFVVGVVTILALEALAAYLLIKRLSRNVSRRQQHRSSDSNIFQQSLLNYAFKNKGVVWVLEPDKVPKFLSVEKIGRGQKKKKEVLEVYPVEKVAEIKDGFLVLTHFDGTRDHSSVTVPLKGCIVEAVSATNLPSRKWAKRYPIKVESKTSPIYNGSKTFYLYLETSPEKESWCKALRLASCDDEGRLKWFSKVNEDFLCYLTSLNARYSSFFKPSAGIHSDFVEKGMKSDPSASKFRHFVKKLAKRASKISLENRGSSSWLAREERRGFGKSYSLNEPLSATSLVNNSSKIQTTIRAEENMPLPSSCTWSRSVSESHISTVSDADSDDRFNIDQGTLCWNLLISRLFFDAKNNAEVNNSVRERIQRTLSNMRTPSYISEVLCTDLELGNLPPHIHGIRVLPADTNEAWAWEVDVEYSGGLVIYVETRLEVHDTDLQKGIVTTNSESTTVGDVSSDLLKGFEFNGKQLISKPNANAEGQKNDPKFESKNSSSHGSTSTNASRWKSIVNNVAKHVSQVPLSLSLRVSSLRGTVRFHIKPPPTDQLWYGFTSMPDIEIDLEPSVGDHKITSGHFALFLINRFKSSIRETLVIPNNGTVPISWMLAEKNDWAPRKSAPFIWLNHEPPSHVVNRSDDFSSQIDELESKTESSRRASGDLSEFQNQKPTNSEGSQAPMSNDLACTSSTPKRLVHSSSAFEDLRIPLLPTVGQHETCQRDMEQLYESRLPLNTPKFMGKSSVEEDDSRPKRIAARARMLYLGKKMGGKLEEKRRHFKEKGRNIVEKMQGP